MEELQIIGKVFVAMLAGGIIGFEREVKDKPVGIRTNMLVAGASALLVVLGASIVSTFAQSESSDFISADPVGIIRSIVVGISFLGSGAIISRSEKFKVKGMTTGASILFAGAVGTAIALDKYIAGLGIALLVATVNAVIGYIDKTWLHNLLNTEQKEDENEKDTGD